MATARTPTQRRLSASQQARNDFDDYCREGGEAYIDQRAWDEDAATPDYYEDFLMPEPSGFDACVEDENLDSMIQMWER